MTLWREHLPRPMPARGEENRLCNCTWGEFSVDIPAHLAARICDLRFEEDGTVWGLRCRDDEWVELTAFGAVVRDPVELEPLGMEG